MPLPKALASKKAIIDVKNEDSEYFKWALLSASYPNDSHQKIEIPHYRKYEDKLNLKSIVNFPTPTLQIPTAE